MSDEMVHYGFVVGEKIAIWCKEYQYEYDRKENFFSVKPKEATSPQGEKLIVQMHSYLYSEVTCTYCQSAARLNNRGVNVAKLFTCASRNIQTTYPREVFMEQIEMRNVFGPDNKDRIKLKIQAMHNLQECMCTAATLPELESLINLLRKEVAEFKEITKENNKHADVYFVISRIATTALISIFRNPMLPIIWVSNPEEIMIRKMSIIIEMIPDCVFHIAVGKTSTAKEIDEDVATLYNIKMLEKLEIPSYIKEELLKSHLKDYQQCKDSVLDVFKLAGVI